MFLSSLNILLADSPYAAHTKDNEGQIEAHVLQASIGLEDAQGNFVTVCEASISTIPVHRCNVATLFEILKQSHS